MRTNFDWFKFLFNLESASKHGKRASSERSWVHPHKIPRCKMSTPRLIVPIEKLERTPIEVLESDASFCMTIFYLPNYCPLVFQEHGDRFSFHKVFQCRRFGQFLLILKKLLLYEFDGYIIGKDKIKFSPNKIKSHLHIVGKLLKTLTNYHNLSTFINYVKKI